MEFYCPPCETAMCQECTGGEHGDHPTVPLKDVVEQHKASLQQHLDAVKRRYCAAAEFYRFIICTVDPQVYDVHEILGSWTGVFYFFSFFLTLYKELELQLRSKGLLTNFSYFFSF